MKNKKLNSKNIIFLNKTFNIYEIFYKYCLFLLCFFNYDVNTLILFKKV